MPAVDLSHWHAHLKARHRAERAAWPQPLSLRIHRSLSWLLRAAREPEDPDLRFILLWIAFNAAYAAEVGAAHQSTRAGLADYFDRLCERDGRRRIYDILWSRYPQEIRLLLQNRFVFQPFWNHLNGEPGHEEWAERMEDEARRVRAALKHSDTPKLLRLLFERLYTLRNQLVHGGATWNGGVNRAQVRDGAAILGALLPVFLEIMMDCPDADWGRPYYPVVDT